MIQNCLIRHGKVEPKISVTALPATRDVSGEWVWVDDSGVVYNEAVVLKDGIVLISKNWDATDGSDRASIQSPDNPGVLSVSASNVTGAAVTGFNILPG